MDPISIVTAAAAIAKAAGLDTWLQDKFDRRPGAQAARKIVDLASAAAGGGTPAEVIERLGRDASAAADARRILLEWEQELVRLQLQDQADARDLYRHQPATADRLARQIMCWNLPAVVALVAANCVAVIHLDNPTVAVAIGNVIGASITYLWAERAQVVGFFFGSSLGSKDKDARLTTLTPRPRP